MPLTVRTSCGCRPSSESAIFSAFKTPKSPQPGHQSGSAFPLNSFTGSGEGRLGLRSIGNEVSTRSSPICNPPPMLRPGGLRPSRAEPAPLQYYGLAASARRGRSPLLLHPDLVHRDVLLRLPQKEFLHAVDDVMRQERLAVVLADG